MNQTKNECLPIFWHQKIFECHLLRSVNAEHIGCIKIKTARWEKEKGEAANSTSISIWSISSLSALLRFSPCWDVWSPGRATTVPEEVSAQGFNPGTLRHKEKRREKSAYRQKKNLTLNLSQRKRTKLACSLSFSNDKMFLRSWKRNNWVKAAKTTGKQCFRARLGRRDRSFGMFLMKLTWTQ